MPLQPCAFRLISRSRIGTERCPSAGNVSYQCIPATGRCAILTRIQLAARQTPHRHHAWGPSTSGVDDPATIDRPGRAPLATSVHAPSYPCGVQHVSHPTPVDAPRPAAASSTGWAVVSNQLSNDMDFNGFATQFCEITYHPGISTTGGNVRRVSSLLVPARSGSGDAAAGALRRGPRRPGRAVNTLLQHPVTTGGVYVGRRGGAPPQPQPDQGRRDPRGFRAPLVDTTSSCAFAFPAAQRAPSANTD